jgi:hypothetical protein
MDLSQPTAFSTGHDEADQIAFCAPVWDCVNLFEPRSAAQFQRLFVHIVHCRQNRIESTYLERKPEYLADDPTGEALRFLNNDINHAGTANKTVPPDSNANIFFFCQFASTLVWNE